MRSLNASSFVPDLVSARLLKRKFKKEIQNQEERKFSSAVNLPHPKELQLSTKFCLGRLPFDGNAVRHACSPVKMHFVAFVLRDVVVVGRLVLLRYNRDPIQIHSSAQYACQIQRNVVSHPKWGRFIPFAYQHRIRCKIAQVFMS